MILTNKICGSNGVDSVKNMPPPSTFSTTHNDDNENVGAAGASGVVVVNNGGGGGGGGGNDMFVEQTTVVASDDSQHPYRPSSDDDSGCAMDEYTWIPPGLSQPEQVYRYFSYIPENKIPYVNSVGERYRIRQLLLQMPPHDSESKYCQNLTEHEKRTFAAFALQRKENALGRAVVKLTESDQIRSTIACEKNLLQETKDSIGEHSFKIHNLKIAESIDKKKEISSFKRSIDFVSDNPVIGETIKNQSYLSSTSGEERGYFHPHCFTCHTCDELLIDLTYFYHAGSVYCGRHYSELIRPRCSACDEIIFADECTEAEGRSWHMHHFVCSQCDTNLGGERYILRDGHPYCCTCFETLFAELCDTCGDAIGVDQGQMSHGGQHWHATAECFCCQTCQSPLLNRPFLPKYGAIFCSSSCARSCKFIPTSTRQQQSTNNKEIGMKNKTKTILSVVSAENADVQRNDDDDDDDDVKHVSIDCCDSEVDLERFCDDEAAGSTTSLAGSIQQRRLLLPRPDEEEGAELDGSVSVCEAIRVDEKYDVENVDEFGQDELSEPLITSFSVRDLDVNGSSSSKKRKNDQKNPSEQAKEYLCEARSKSEQAVTKKDAAVYADESALLKETCVGPSPIAGGSACNCCYCNYHHHHCCVCQGSGCVCNAGGSSTTTSTCAIAFPPPPPPPHHHHCHALHHPMSAESSEIDTHNQSLALNDIRTKIIDKIFAENSSSSSRQLMYESGRFAAANQTTMIDNCNIRGLITSQPLPQTDPVQLPAWYAPPPQMFEHRRPSSNRERGAGRRRRESRKAAAAAAASNDYSDETSDSSTYEICLSSQEYDSGADAGEQTHYRSQHSWVDRAAAASSSNQEPATKHHNRTTTTTSSGSGSNSGSSSSSGSKSGSRRSGNDDESFALRDLLDPCGFLSNSAIAAASRRRCSSSKRREEKRSLSSSANTRCTRKDYYSGSCSSNSNTRKVRRGTETQMTHHEITNFEYVANDDEPQTINNIPSNAYSNKPTLAAGMGNPKKLSAFISTGSSSYSKKMPGLSDEMLRKKKNKNCAIS